MILSSPHNAETMESSIVEVLNKINANLARLAACRVPPPSIFDGSSDVKVFFKQFEAHCTAIYGENYDAWLQVLPSFTDGEPRNIVQSFGMGNTVTYTLVKERLLTECKRRTFGTNAITDFYGAVRRAGETLVCYSIRLQSLADMITDAPAWCKFAANLVQICSSSIFAAGSMSM